MFKFTALLVDDYFRRASTTHGRGLVLRSSSPRDGIDSRKPQLVNKKTPPRSREGLKLPVRRFDKGNFGILSQTNAHFAGGRGLRSFPFYTEVEFSADATFL